VAISFACPSCEHRLKVKDELAGRKVKCPGCGNGVSVPADEEDEEAPAAKDPPSRKAREGFSDEERPRKKKKKKKANKGLVIGLAAGAIVLVALVVVLVIVFSRPNSQSHKGPGDENVVQNPPPKQEPPQQMPAPPQPHPEQRPAGFANRGEDQAVMNDMRQIGIFYNQYLITNPRGPQDSKAFANEIRRDAPRIAKALDNRVYRLLPGARRAGNMLVAYDEPGNSAGMHVVVMGDGSVQTMGRQELQKHLPPQGKQ
jgi:hypothetical protein